MTNTLLHIQYFHTSLRVEVRAAPDIHKHTPLKCGPFLLATEHLMKSGFNDLAEDHLKNDWALHLGDIWVLPPTFLQANNMIIAVSVTVLWATAFNSLLEVISFLDVH